MNVRSCLIFSVLALLLCLLAAPLGLASEKDGGNAVCGNIPPAEGDGGLKVKVGDRKETGMYRNLLRFNVGYSTNEYAFLEVAYHYFFNRYAGVGGGVSLGVNYLGKNMPGGELVDSDYTEWRMIIDEEGNSRLDALGPKFLLSGIFRTPFLVDSRKFRLSCLLEPGAVFAVPYSKRGVLLTGGAEDDATEYVKSWGGRCVFWQFRGTVLAAFGDFGIGLSYSLNDIDVFSTVRTLSYAGTDFRDYYPARKPLYHSFAITVSYLF